ncbi:hypothetical protein SFUMM280S_11062 [Streptomyces fumanus]
MTLVVGQAVPEGVFGASSWANPVLFAEQIRPSAGPEAGKPFGPSTLCGSHWIAPQLLTEPFWQSFCRLIGRSV